MEVIAKQMEKTLGKIIRERVLLNSEAWKQKHYRIPKFRLIFQHQRFIIIIEEMVVRVEFANISEITDTYRETITEMRKYFDRGGDWFNVGIEGKENWSFQAVDKYSPVCGQHRQRLIHIIQMIFLSGFVLHLPILSSRLSFREVHRHRRRHRIQAKSAPLVQGV